MPSSKIKKVVESNCYGTIIPGTNQKVVVLCALSSLINHGKVSNVYISNPCPEIAMVRAKKDIKKGEQLFADYVMHVTETKERNNLLKHWGIDENRPIPEEDMKLNV